MTRRTIAASAFLLLALTIFAGCGSSSKTASNATTSTRASAHAAKTRATPNDSKTAVPNNAALGWNAPKVKRALQNFAACMRRHHIDLPPPNTTGKGNLFDERHIVMNTPEFNHAYKTCTPDLPPHFLSN